MQYALQNTARGQVWETPKVGLGFVRAAANRRVRTARDRGDIFEVIIFYYLNGFRELYSSFLVR